MLAKVHKVIVPEEGITPGKDLTVSVVLLPHWSAADDERTIQRDVTIEVPEYFPFGPALLTVDAAGSSSDLPDEVLLPLTIISELFSGPDEEPVPDPENLDELIQQMKDRQIDPSEITLTLETLLPPEAFLPPEPVLPPEVGVPPDGMLPPDGLPLPEDGEMPPDGEMPRRR